MTTSFQPMGQWWMLTWIGQYGCFIETCERKCSTPQKRRLHLIDKHMFPRVGDPPLKSNDQLLTSHHQSYNFYIINDGIDRQTSLLRPMNSGRRRLSAASVSSVHEGRLRRRSSASQSRPPAIAPRVLETRPKTLQQETSNDMEIDELEQSMSALRFVPASVTRNRPKAPQKHY